MREVAGEQRHHSPAAIALRLNCKLSAAAGHTARQAAKSVKANVIGNVIDRDMIAGPLYQA